MNEEGSREQLGPEEGADNRGAPASDQSSDYRSSQSDSLAEDVPRSDAEDVPRDDSEDVPRSEEEMRARIEEQVRKLRVQDLMVESVVSVLNLTARRIAKEDERDLGQAKVGIDAVRAWVDLLPGDAAKQIRNALSELQLLYARTAEETAGAEKEGNDEPPEPESGAQPRPSREPRRGEPPPPRLWTPPGST